MLVSHDSEKLNLPVCMPFERHESISERIELSSKLSGIGESLLTGGIRESSLTGGIRAAFNRLLSALLSEATRRFAGSSEKEKMVRIASFVNCHLQGPAIT